jgi:hypothetical protein
MVLTSPEGLQNKRGKCICGAWDEEYYGENRNSLLWLLKEEFFTATLSSLLLDLHQLQQR